MSESKPSAAPDRESLHDKNLAMLRALVLAHVFACVVWILGPRLGDLPSLQDAASSALSLTLLTLASLATIALRNTVPQQWKARLVFLHWAHPLPGCRAFSEYLAGDDRIKEPEMRQKYAYTLHDPRKQNEEWYKLLSFYQDRFAYIAYNHRMFLLLLDSVAIILVLLPLCFTALWYADKLHRAGLPLFYVMLVEFLIAWVAARNAGIGLVRDVLARESDALREPETKTEPDPRSGRVAKPKARPH